MKHLTGQRTLPWRGVGMLLAVLWPALALAQPLPAIGIVTTLKGQATVSRAALPQPLPLQFKDKVFYSDRISTKERSLLRVLLKGKSLVTVRELSELTIAEAPGLPSIVDLLRGKISLSATGLRKRAGEAIEIRTPNAVATVHGTVIVVEVTSLPAQATRTGAPAYLTTFHVLEGSLDVTTRARPEAPPVTLAEGFSISISDIIGPTYRHPPAFQLLRDLKSDPQFIDTPEEAKKDLSTEARAQAVALANAWDEDELGPFPAQLPPLPDLVDIYLPTTLRPISPATPDDD